MSKFENPKRMTGSPLRPDQSTADVPAPGNPAAPAAPAAPAEGKPAAPRRRLVIGLAAALAVAVGAYEAYDYWTVGRFLYSTDDAYLKADTTILAAKVAGYIADLPVAENTAVKAGATLTVIDPGDYRIAVASARAKVLTQDATIARLGKQIEAQKAAVEQARAAIGSAKADAVRASADLDRTNSLAKNQFASIKSLDQARADGVKAAQSVIAAEAAFAAAGANLEVAVAQQAEAEAARADLQAALEKAERDLAFATVKAPIDGVVGNRAAHIGDYVQPGTRLMAIVPVRDIYVEANFKETQLARMYPGQPATVTVDALSGASITGTVESLSPASGSLYSLLPPENATGNFTKIVQRLPVRIRLPADKVASGGLRAGLSVVVTVDTRTTPPAAAGPGAAATVTAARP